MDRCSSFSFRYPPTKRVRCSFLTTFVVSLVLSIGTAFSQATSPAQPQTPSTSDQTLPPPPPPDVTAPDEAAQPSSNVRVIRLSDVEGVVKVYQGGQVAFEQAQPNMPAVQGMRFVTGENGRLEIELEDGSVARVTPNSSIRLTKLRRDDDGTTTTQIDALTGLSYYELNSRGGEVSVHFDTEAVTPIDSAAFRISLDAAPNELAVMHGAVHVDDRQNVAVDVHPNQTFQTDPQRPGEFNVAQSLKADSWDQWNSDRDEDLAKLESDQSTARASGGNPDDAAWNDLDYYGNWYDLPGYGQVWSPAGVDENWDPFAEGSWGYYPSFGYTWISAYPWGWLPYHCGAWNFATGWGWMWIPSNCGWGYWGAGWNPYVTVWQMPKGYRPPPRPRHGPGPLPRPTPLYAVSRGAQFSAPFRKIGGIRPQPRPLTFDGKVIQPLEPGIHPRMRGPLGESFTTSLVRTHPELAPEMLPGFSTTIPGGVGGRPIGSAPGFPRVNPGSTVRPVAPGGGVLRPAPGGGHVTPGPVTGGHPAAPAAAPHAAPSGGGEPHGGGGGGHVGSVGGGAHR